MTYRLHPEAETEHLETVAWYESRRPGLGARYLAEFEQVLEQVCRNPRRFPFTILYREAESGVDVLAVAHHRRRPMYWSVRLRAPSVRDG